MRLLSRLTVAVVACFVAIALPSVPAQAQCDGPFIELVPGSGVPGTRLIVQGRQFNPGKYIDIYYDGTLVSEGESTSASGDFAISFTIPESCKGDHPILVRAGTSVGTVERETAFYATPGLMVSPEKGPQGTTVTVTGHGFIEDEDGISLMYYTDGGYERVGRDIKADANGYWETSFQIPTSDRGERRIDAEGTFSRTYDVKDATFKVTAGISIDRSSGGVGDNITMTGTRFELYEKNIQILFDGQPVVMGIKADGQGDWKKTFDLPDMPAGNYTVTATGEQTPEQDVIALSFEIRSNILLSPATGHVGTNVTVTGYGLAAAKDASIMYDGTEVTTAKTDDQGNLEASFPVPPSQHGEHPVTIGYSDDTEAGATFTLESVPPGTPQLISPSEGSRVGFRGRITPTFGWTAVSDDSGVTYSLQIATSPDVTSTGEFVQPMFSVSGLSGTNYTVTQTLPHATYYWIVRAVDGAQNEGDWTTPRSLRVGVIPLWAFIAVIVAVVVLLIVLIRALVRRRSYYYE